MAEDDLDGGAKDRAYYTSQSCQAAFGDPNPDAWDPSQGFGPNRDRMIQLYKYYQSLYLKQSDLFLWAGLGYLAGATIVSGLDQVLAHDAEGDVTQTLVGTAKNIFLDLGWLHEAYLDAPDTAIALAHARDSVSPTPAMSYGQAWEDIASGDSMRVASGNQALLQNEQACLVQPGMDRLTQLDPPLFGRTRAFTKSVHPYHRDFLLVRPEGSVASFDDRWYWITEPDGMWAKWVAMPNVAPDERPRLASLDFGDLMNRQFGPLVDALMWPGGTDEDA